MMKFSLVFLPIFILTLFSLTNCQTDYSLRAFWSIISLKDGTMRFMRDYQAYREKQLADVTPKNRQGYDYIVVGAGSAGATLASRLSEMKNATVLLIEAGGKENLIADVPLLALFLQLNKNIIWDYRSEKSDDYCRAMYNNQCNIARGKIMGGCSTINFMIATRGHRADYDEWAELTGDESWSYDNLLQYFKKLEKFNVTLTDIRAEIHGFDGPINIMNPPYRTSLADGFIQAGKDFGYPVIDINDQTRTGFSYMQNNLISGERLSTNRAYLLPVKGRQNLFLTMNSQATKILIDPATKTAYGVRFVKAGKIIEVIARKEVILSAGPINSPQLLMLSGIGPAKHLQSFGIDVLNDLPVGENLIDHFGYGGLTFLSNRKATKIIPELINPVNNYVSDYLNKRSGPFVTPGGVEALSFLNVDDPFNDEPNIEILLAGQTGLSSYVLHIPFALRNDIYTKIYADKLYHHGFQIVVLLMKPKSRGKILLRDKDPLKKPRIIPNYFSDPDDMRVLIKGIRQAIEIGKSSAMKSFDAEYLDVTVPECKEEPSGSDAYWECMVRSLTTHIWHQSGTCKMGRQDDPTAVVNAKLQVKGVKKLRVVDSSVMPNIITGHTNIPTIAIAEKAADIIKLHAEYKD